MELPNAKTYVEQHLSREMETFIRRGMDLEEDGLSLYDKVLIFKYTLDGYEAINEALRAGKDHPMAALLNEAIEKLPDYRGMVFRGTVLSNLAKASYRDKMERKLPVGELGFLSTSRSRNIANQFNRNDTLFKIYSFHGKMIEQYSFHGISNPFNEREVLFRSNTQFAILDIEDESGATLKKYTMIKTDKINQFEQKEIDAASTSFFRAFHFEQSQDKGLIERRKNALETFITSINGLLANRLIEDEDERKSLLRLLDKLISQKESFELMLMQNNELKDVKAAAQNFAAKTRNAVG